MALKTKQNLALVIAITLGYLLNSCGIKGSPYSPKGRQDTYPRVYPPIPQEAVIPNPAMRKDTNKK